MENEKCQYCEGTGYIGSPYDLGHYPCTDCEIWERKLEDSRKI